MNPRHFIQPAHAFDASGNYLIAYYGFLSGSSQYEHLARYATISGNTITLESQDWLRTTASNAASYNADPPSGQVLLGEYHDMSCSNGSIHY